MADLVAEVDATRARVQAQRERLAGFMNGGDGDKETAEILDGMAQTIKSIDEIADLLRQAGEKWGR